MRRQLHLAAEGTGQALRLAEAHPVGDLGGGEFGVEQQVFGLLYAAFEQEIGKGEAGSAADAVKYGTGADAKMLGQTKNKRIKKLLDYQPSIFSGANLAYSDSTLKHPALLVVLSQLTKEIRRHSQPKTPSSNLVIVRLLKLCHFKLSPCRKPESIE